MELSLPDGTNFLVDVEDIPKIFNNSWHIFNNRDKKYIRGWDKRLKKKVLLHRLIMEVIDFKDQVDHINGNTLDNRKSNLRICSHRDNILNRDKYKNNSSGYKGVSKSGDKWIATIGINNKKEYLGIFENKEDARIAYDNAAILNFGEFARINKDE